MKRFLVISLVILMFLMVSVVSFAGEKELIFASTQLVPAAEKEFMIGTILKNFTEESGVPVNFVGLTYNEILSRLSAEQKTGKTTISLVGDLHGGLDVMSARDLLSDLSNLTLPYRTFISTLENYSVIRNKKVYIPWMQATYVMVVNKRAYDCLPEGLTRDDITKASDKWTYEALLAWAKNLNDKTGSPKFGLPMSPKGLFHRFLHGYLLPSFTGYQAKEFASKDGIAAWEYIRKLVKYIHPASSVWSAMDEPLKKEEVLFAWDHTARIKSAIVESPDKFEVIPVPRGPKGRGFIVVAVGLAVPQGVPEKENAYKLIEYLTRPKVQIQILEKVGFFPTVKQAVGTLPEGALKVLAKGVSAQSSAKDAIVAMIPNLGKKGGEFTSTYRDVFKKVVLQNKDIAKEVEKAGEKLTKLFGDAGIPVQ